MSWFSILKLVLEITGSLTSWLQNKKLLDAGQAQVLAELLKKNLENVEKATAARDAVNTSPDSVRDDPFNRDSAR